jgi:hypothetical protein
VDIGTPWGEQLQKSYLLRNQVVHAPPNKPLALVSHDELYDACLVKTGDRQDDYLHIHGSKVIVLSVTCYEPSL